MQTVEWWLYITIGKDYYVAAVILNAVNGNVTGWVWVMHLLVFTECTEVAENTRFNQIIARNVSSDPGGYRTPLP